MGVNFKLHERFQLHVDEGIIVIAPHESEDVLVIDRVTFKIELQGPSAVVDSVTPKSQEIYGCMGIINLFSGPHLIVISQIEEVGTIGGIPIFEVTKTHIIQVARSLQSLTEDERKQEKEYISLLNDFLEDCKFYFSYSYDITHSCQRIANMNVEDREKPLWQRVDERFFWNKHLQSVFIQDKLDQFILPVVDGCARYHTRGADPLGNVANFVETEQIVRGSIPFFWQQKGKGLKPKPVVDISSSAELAFRRHMEGLISSYGPVAVVSLIDQRGIEVPVGESFETHMYILNNPKLKYVPFDFHEKCKNNKYENLSQLLDIVGPDLTQGSYFLRDEQGNPVLKQTGLVRTNCIDCLDRTNVVQSVFAKQVLMVQLNHLGILGSNEKLEQHPNVESMFKHVWADNADIMSEQYTGTVALKTDFTRTGKRSVKGTMMDGVNSAKRYINKTFNDDEKQEVIDLFLGHFVVEKWNGVIEEGTYRFVDLSMINDWTSKGMNCILQVNLIQRKITWYLTELGQRTDIPFDSLIQIEKAARDHKLLRLHHSGSPHPVRFAFPTASIREQFTQLLYYSHPPLNPTSDIPRIPEKPYLKLKIFIGTWNMTSTDPSSEDLPAWIPKDKDFYAIGTQHLVNMPIWKTEQASVFGLSKSREILLKTVRRKTKLPKQLASHEDHKVPPPYSMPCKEYWHLMIRQYLGSDYIALATINTEETSLIVLVRQHMCSMVNNLEVTPVKLREKNIKLEEKKGGLAKLKEAREKIKDQMKTNKEKNNVYGAAVLFRFVETAFCMMNYSIDNGVHQNPNANANTIDSEESIMHLKGDYDLHNDFHHVFWFGNLAKNNPTQKWVSLYTHEENGGGNSVLWRALHDAPMLSEIEVGNVTPQCSACQTSLAAQAANLFLEASTPNSHHHVHGSHENHITHEASKHEHHHRHGLFHHHHHHHTDSSPNSPSTALSPSSSSPGSPLSPTPTHQPFFTSPNPPAFTKAAVGIFLPPLPSQPLLSRNHYCTIALSNLMCTQTKPDLYLVCHAPFLVFPGRTGFLKKSDDGCWNDEITVRSFIIDRDYIDMLHLRIELWERGLIGDEDRLGVGVISMKSSNDVQALAFTTVLWDSNEFVGELTGDISLTFLDASDEPDVILPDPNHPFTPPMSIPNFTRSATPDSTSSSPPKNDTLSPPSSNSNSSPSSAPSSAPSNAPISSSPFGGGFFKLPFPQIGSMGARETGTRYSFFGKKETSTSAVGAHRDSPVQQEGSKESSLSNSLELASEELEISQPLTSPHVTPTRNLTSPQRSLSSSPVPGFSVDNPSQAEDIPQDLPPKLPPKPARRSADPSPNLFSPINPASPIDTPPQSDSTGTLSPTPLSPPISTSPISSPPTMQDSPGSESEGTSSGGSGARSIINRIRGIGIISTMIRASSSPNPSASAASSNASDVISPASSPRQQRRPPSTTPMQQSQSSSQPSQANVSPQPNTSDS